MRMHTHAAAAASMLLAFAGSAFAHATLVDRESPPDTTFKAILSVPHGCDGQPTNAVEVRLPDGFIAAKPMPKPGWVLEIESGPFERSYDYHGRVLSSGPRVIRWTGGNLADAHYDEFVVRGRVADLAAGTVLAFPTVQTCPDGEVAWVEVPAPGADAHDLAAPAPLLTVIAGASTDGHAHGHSHADAHDHEGEHSAHGNESDRAASSVGSGDAAMLTAGTATAGSLVIEGAWTREPPSGANVVGGYMNITNTGDTDDVLIGGSAPFADVFEVHEMSVTDGMMRMAEIEGGLAIPAGETVSLAPGGYHVMFVDITDALRQGETVDVSLVFQNAGEVMVQMPVAAIGAQNAHDHSHHGHD